MKNEPKTNPISENPKMNLTPYKKRDYVKYMTFGPQKNKPNFELEAERRSRRAGFFDSSDRGPIFKRPELGAN